MQTLLNQIRIYKMTIKLNSLVVYKNSPAIIKSVGDKYEIELLNNSSKKVRIKDFQLIHSGPVSSLNNISKQKIDKNSLKDAWELILEEGVDLSELSELIFGENSPSNAWTTWELLCENFYFKGDIDLIEARSEEEINLILAKKESKAAAEQEREELLNRIRKACLIPEDSKFMKEIEQVAFGTTLTCRLMQDLKLEQTPEKAHEVLLKTSSWNNFINPYPQRFNISKPDNAPAVPELPPEERMDLTHLEAFAIDDEGSNDPDDAISLDGDSIWVHIADVASIVTPGSELDIFARDRGTNLYVPENIYPMLPKKITEILGLGLNKISPALSIKLKFDEEFNPLIEKIILSSIKVTRLTYNEANDQIENEPFKSLLNITDKYGQKRIANGAVNINLPEVKIKYQPDKISISPIHELLSRELVQEAMLMTGEAIAKFAISNDIPIPFASQTFKQDITVPEQDDLAGMFNCIRKLKPGTVSTTTSKHSGLGLECYSRVTSPLRRYPDLLTHQQIRKFLQQSPFIDDEIVSKQISEVQPVIKDYRTVERNSNKHWTLAYMDSINWTGEAVLVDKYYNKGTFIIPELAYEARLQIDDKMELNAKVQLEFTGMNLPTLTGSFRIMKGCDPNGTKISL